MWHLKYSLSLAIVCCVLIIGLGLGVILVQSSPGNTIIVEDISQRDITATRDMMTFTGGLRAQACQTATLVVAASNSSPRSRAQADFVATGVNDQVTIQAAIDALPAGGGKVLLLEGTYIIHPLNPVPAIIGHPSTYGINVSRSNISVVGQGLGTILRMVGGVNASAGVITSFSPTGNTLSNIHFSKFKVDLNGTAQAATGLTVSYFGVRFFRVRNSSISEILVVNNVYGENITIGQSSECIIINNMVRHSGGDGIGIGESTNCLIANNVINLTNPHGWILSEGIDLAHSANEITVTGNVLLNTGSGIAMREASHNNLIEGNRILNAFGKGIIILDGSNRNSIKNNVIRSSTMEGIFVGSSHFSSITGNVVSESRSHGIYIIESNNNIVSSNTFIANTQGGHGVMDLDGAATHNNLITNNIFRHAGIGVIPFKSIRLHPAVADNWVINNDVRHGASGSIINAGARNIIRDNAGHVTENSDTVTIPTGATSVNITHGLAATPLRVLVTPTTDTAGRRFWVSARTATIFTITLDARHTAPISFDWKAYTY
jgi:parallel beta-helix repeat protein